MPKKHKSKSKSGSKSHTTKSKVHNKNEINIKINHGKSKNDAPQYIPFGGGGSTIVNNIPPPLPFNYSDVNQNSAYLLMLNNLQNEVNNLKASTPNIQTHSEIHQAAKDMNVLINQQTQTRSPLILADSQILQTDAPKEPKLISRTISESSIIGHLVSPSEQSFSESIGLQSEGDSGRSEKPDLSSKHIQTETLVVPTKKQLSEKQQESTSYKPSELDKLNQYDQIARSEPTIRNTLVNSLGTYLNKQIPDEELDEMLKADKRKLPGGWEAVHDKVSSLLDEKSSEIFGSGKFY